MSNNYLLLKVSAIEHVSPSDPCRIAEDILTIVCNQIAPGSPPPSPSPTATSTPTPTPTPLGSFDTSLTIAGTNRDINTYSSDGITFTSSGGATFSFDKKSLSSTIGIMSIRKGTLDNSTEIARIIFADSYLNSRFRITIGVVNYSGVFINDSIYFA